MKIIGVNGFKRVGKGETCNFIAQVAPGTVLETGFAHKLKVLAGLTLGFDRSDEELIALADSMKVDGLLNVEYEEVPRQEDRVLHSITMREFYQELGTRARSLFGDSFWVDQVLPRPALDGGTLARPKGLQHPATDYALTQRYPGVDLLTIGDVRFPNEAERIIALGGEVWEVIRPGAASDGHASEQPLPRHLVTRQIVNDGTLTDLRDKVTEALA